ncbi:amidoligase family protein [Sulfurovum sp. CS9]|uniref:amidoligase family protein n=1 Tax=Sulfurovum sp. CS9 TaxID=3391146 RepID=UPI0039EB812C
MDTNFFMPPPISTNQHNEPRKVGFELEYSSLELKTSAALVVEELGVGQIEMINPYHYKINGTPYGDFTLVLDFQFLIKHGLGTWLHEAGLDLVLNEEITLAIEEFIATLSETVVPYEISTSPLALEDLGVIERIKDLFRKHGAMGTKANPFYACGFHVNSEVSSLEVEEIIDTLRAFFLLYDYLIEWLQPDMKRRIAPYIDPYEESYIMKVLDPSYAPTMAVFIDDYITYNPTRNHALDLLPLLTWIDRDRVMGVLEDEKISARPAYHYRLPDSKIDEPLWHTYDAWNSWVLVETLACDKEALQQMSETYSVFLSLPLAFLQKEEWIMEVRRWINTQLS